MGISNGGIERAVANGETQEPDEQTRVPDGFIQQAVVTRRYNGVKNLLTSTRPGGLRWHLPVDMAQQSPVNLGADVSAVLRRAELTGRAERQTPSFMQG